MPRNSLIPLPTLTPDRLLMRVAEAMQVALEPSKIEAFPAWTRRVMRILKQQFVPADFETVLAAHQTVFAEGIATALVTKAQDIAQATGANGALFAQMLSQMLGLDPQAGEVALQVSTGEFALSESFRKRVMERMFSPDFAERRAFIEGMTAGNRLPELFDTQARRNATDATEIYLMLWLYWPEISQLNSIGEVARLLEPMFATNRNKAGAHWEERIRKLSNRIGLSFQAKQARKRKRIARR